MSIYGFSELDCNVIYPKYLAFRHRVFNEHLKYNKSGNPVFSFQAFTVDETGFSSDSISAAQEFGIEYDNYDIPKAIHLAYTHNIHSIPPSSGSSVSQILNQSQNVMGCLRFLPTDGHYMIKDNIEQGVWKNVELLVDKLPSERNVYEASRIAVALHLGRDDGLREIVLDNLVYANVELAARLGIKKMIGIMYDRVWKSVYMDRGVPIKYISKPFCVDDGLPIIIGEIDTSQHTLDQLNHHYLGKLARKIITPAALEPATWLMHYNHVNNRLPEYQAVPIKLPQEFAL